MFSHLHNWKISNLFQKFGYSKYGPHELLRNSDLANNDKNNCNKILFNSFSARWALFLEHFEPLTFSNSKSFIFQLFSLFESKKFNSGANLDYENPHNMLNREIQHEIVIIIF